MLIASRRWPVPPLAKLLRVDTGLSLPIVGEEGSGELLLVGIVGPSRDDLALGAAIADEAARTLDRCKLVHTAREVAASRIRTSLARDLHDSVAQTLAGTGFRLAALRTRLVSGEQPIGELDAIAANMRDEQAHVRNIIDSLRHRDLQDATTDLGAALRDLVPTIGRQWGITAEFQWPENRFNIPASHLFDFQQIVREGIANAVRHGKASQVVVKLERYAGGTTLAIRDNGCGFSDDAPSYPRSIAERVATMHGLLAVHSKKGETLLMITLPDIEIA